MTDPTPTLADIRAAMDRLREQLAEMDRLFARFADLIDASNRAAHYLHTGRKPAAVPVPRPAAKEQR